MVKEKRFYVLWDAYIEQGYVLPTPNDVCIKLEEYTKYDLIKIDVELQRVEKNDYYTLYLIKENGVDLVGEDKKKFDRFVAKVNKCVEKVLNSK